MLLTGGDPESGYFGSVGVISLSLTFPIRVTSYLLLNTSPEHGKILTLQTPREFFIFTGKHLFTWELFNSEGDFSQLTLENMLIQVSYI